VDPFPALVHHEAAIPRPKQAQRATTTGTASRPTLSRVPAGRWGFSPLCTAMCSRGRTADTGTIEVIATGRTSEGQLR